MSYRDGTKNLVAVTPFTMYRKLCVLSDINYIFTAKTSTAQIDTEVMHVDLNINAIVALGSNPWVLLLDGDLRWVTDFGFQSASSITKKSLVITIPDAKNPVNHTFSIIGTIGFGIYAASTQGYSYQCASFYRVYNSVQDVEDIEAMDREDINQFRADLGEVPTGSLQAAHLSISIWDTAKTDGWN